MKLEKSMKGKDTFTSVEIIQLIELIKIRNRTESSRQKGVRDKMRAIGFYGRDDWKIIDLQVSDLEKLIQQGKVKISDFDFEKRKIENGKKTEDLKTKKQEEKNKDEFYVLDLCDKALNSKSFRQHKFDFLLGDPNEKGNCKKLPVDAYYEKLNLVIEYREKQHTESVTFFDKPEKMTISGVHRGEQRKIYDQRRKQVLPEHNIKLIEISYSDFNYDKQKRIRRNPSEDIKVIKAILKDFIGK